MTLTQVSTWFANARRRLKKENKMTWEPRNKAESSHDEDPQQQPKREPADEDSSAGSPHKDDGPPHGYRAEDGEKGIRMAPETQDIDLSGHHRGEHPFRPSLGEQLHPPPQQHYEDSHPSTTDMLAPSSLEATTSSGYTPSSQSSSPDLDSYLHHRPKDHPHHHHPLQQQCYPPDSYKPKIWSLADTATNKALMPYDLCPQTGGWLSAGGTMGGGGGGTTTVALKGGGGGNNAFQSCSAAAMRFGGGSYGCFNPISLQTDTPPQTPPNMKVSSAAHQGATAATVPSSAYIETAHATAYMGQQALCPQDAIGDAQMQGEKVDSFSGSHGSAMAPSSSSNPNSDCISEEYDDPSQYTTPSVR